VRFEAGKLHLHSHCGAANPGSRIGLTWYRWSVVIGGSGAVSMLSVFPPCASDYMDFVTLPAPEVKADTRRYPPLRSLWLQIIAVDC
jgi:hypothetical protein